METALDISAEGDLCGCVLWVVENEKIFWEPRLVADEVPSCRGTEDRLRPEVAHCGRTLLNTALFRVLLREEVVTSGVRTLGL